MNRSVLQNLTFYISCSLLFLATSFGQAPDLEWQNTIGGSASDFLNTIRQVSDGGYIMGGYSDSNISGDKSENNIGGSDYWVVKVNAAGVIEWEQTVGGGNYDRLYSVEETPDGGYILGGESISGGGVGDKSESNIGGYDYWVVKLDEDGNVEWDNTIGGVGNDMLYDAQPTSDGGYILAGTSESGLTGDKTEDRVGNYDYWIIKLDSSGVVVWQNVIGGLMFDNAYSAKECSDGGFVIAGTSTSGISGDKTAGNYGAEDYWIVKINSSGTVVWDKTIGGTLYDYVYNAIPTSDNGIIAVGLSESGVTGNKTEASNGGYDYWVVKLDADGNIVWQNSIGGTSDDYVFVNPVDETADGYIIAGHSQSPVSGDKTIANTGSWDYWVVKLNTTGAVQWQKVIGGSSGDYVNAIEYTADGGYIIGGYSYSNVSGQKTEAAIGGADYWVMKLVGNGCVPFTEICNGIDDDCDGTIDDDITETISISAEGATTFCQGNSVLLTATHSGTGVQWKRNDVNIPGATLLTYSAIKKGIYSCVTTSPCGTATSESILVNVQKNPVATISADGETTFCAGGSVTLNVTHQPGCSYQWFKGAMPLAGATGLSYVATVAGNYRCRVTRNVTGCYKNSNPISVSVPCREGDATENNSVFIYPNPNNGSFNLDMNGINGNCLVEIYNLMGELISSEMVEEQAGHLAIKLYEPAAGFYFLRIESQGLIITRTFVVE